MTEHLWVRQRVSVPDTWTDVRWGVDGVSMRHTEEPMTAVVSGAREQDGKRWLHLSIARQDRLPTYEELKTAKAEFFGDRKAIQVFAESGEHVNIHPNCLHLFACVDADPLPDFTRGTGSI